jgi:LytS/YehU family sensor histidine kinase
VLLPPFLLLPLVENAIKYGSRTSPDVLHVRVHAQHVAGRVRIEVANTGRWLEPGPASADSTGIGLENLRQRLHRYYPGAHTFAIGTREGWVSAQVELPMTGPAAVAARSEGEIPAQ